ncbi:MAG: glycosyltransferase family 2 protein [Halarcobacter sp.]
MSDLISVVLPVYNGRKYLAEAIESILFQTYENFELIILDDGSTDNSIEIINKYKLIDNRIKVIEQKNIGLIATLNKGLSLSQGDYIARMDQDDISLKNRLELQYNFMKNNSLDLCGCNYNIIDEENNIKKLIEVPLTKDEILITLGITVPFAHPSVMIRKQFIIEHRLMYGLDGYQNAEDLDLWLKCHTKGANFGNVKKTLLHYRVLNSSLSRKNHVKIMKETNIQLKKFIFDNQKIFEQALSKILSKNDIPSRFEKIFLKSCIRYSFISGNYKFLFTSFQKISILNVLISFLSYIKQYLSFIK